MASLRCFWGAGLAGILTGLVPPAAANTYAIILQGKVVTEDGAAPPFVVGLERVCSDNSGSAPGPLANKRGEYTWRMEIDPLATRACFIRATHSGYVSTTVEVQGLDTTKREITLPPLVISAAIPDPYSINASENNVPSRAKSQFKAAMKALDAPDFPEATRQLQAAVEAAPKFAQGWHALGIVLDRQQKSPEARDAFRHAVDSDSKLFPAYVTLARVCLKLKDWEGAAKAADSLIQADPKHTYPEIYLHRAVARYQMKDLAGAEENVQEALRLDPRHKKPRAEYVLGRILEAKGDTSAAREHITKYLQLEPNPPDADLVRAHLEGLGKPALVDPELELL